MVPVVGMLIMITMKSIRPMATFRSHFPQLQGAMIMTGGFEKHNDNNYNYKGHRLRVGAKAPRQLDDHGHLDHDHESESEC